jgi:hypothetical protein
MPPTASPTTPIPSAMSDARASLRADWYSPSAAALAHTPPVQLASLQDRSASARAPK